MAKTPITEAKTITAEVVLELGTYHNAKDLRSVQAKLTSTARELHCFSDGITLLGRIGEKLSVEQRLLLRDTAKLIESIGFNMEHAKEKRRRSEVAAKTRQKERHAAAKKIIEYAYPLPSDTLGHKLEIIRLALVLNRAGCFQPFYTPIEFSLRYALLEQGQSAHQRLWPLITETCPLPLLPHWREPVLQVLTQHNMLQALPGAHGAITAWRLSLQLDVLEPALGDLIRQGQLSTHAHSEPC